MKERINQYAFASFKMILAISLCLPLLFQSSCKDKNSVSENKVDNYTKARRAMVETLIKDYGIKDEQVIQSLLKVERHQFVPDNMKKSAYIDSPLPIGERQTISQPYIVALMTELLALDGTEKVLEIGTGSGYQAAILAEIVSEVYTIEIIKSLADRAENTLKKLGYKNIKVKYGDGYLGWEESAPFDRIIVTCAPDSIPQPLIDQLAENGKIVIPVGGVDTIQQLQIVEKKEGKIKMTSNIPVRFVPLTRELK